MNLIELILIISILFYFAFRIYYYSIIPYFMKKNYKTWAKTINLNKSLSLLDKVYHDIDGFEVSRNERLKKNINSEEFTYGEINIKAFSEFIFYAKPKANDIFYDIGSGSGKAVLLAALLFDLKQSIGIEKLTSIYELSKEPKNKLIHATQKTPSLNKRAQTISFINKDIAEVDFTNADIIFISATCFKNETWHKILKQLVKLKSGSRVIITTKYINDKEFFLKLCWPCLMSWGTATISIYERR